MDHIQEMIKPQKFEEPDGTWHVMAPMIVPKLATAEKCAVPDCASFLLGRYKKRPPGVSKIKATPEKEGILARDKYEVGDFFSTNQFFGRTPGILTSGYGRECRQNRLHSGTIYNDAASGLISVENQVSIGANETVLVKSRFEEWMWEQASAEIYHYHSDNGVFVTNEYRKDCKGKGAKPEILWSWGSTSK